VASESVIPPTPTSAANRDPFTRLTRVPVKERPVGLGGMRASYYQAMRSTAIVARAQTRHASSTIMPAFAVGSSQAADLRSAAAEAYAQAATQLPTPPQLVVLFSSAMTSATEAASLAKVLCPCAALLGRVDAPRKAEPPLTTILAAALPVGSTAQSFHVLEPTVPEFVDLERALRPDAPPTHALLLAARNFPLNAHVAVLDALFPSGVKVGAGGVLGSWLLGGGGAHSSGCAGILLTSTDLTFDVIISHGAARRAAVPITRSSPLEGRLFELGGLPATDLLERVKELDGMRGRRLLLGTTPIAAPGAAAAAAAAAATAAAAAAAANATKPLLDVPLAPPPPVVLGSLDAQLALSAAGSDADGRLCFDPSTCPPMALGEGTSLELLEVDAALADEDLLVCSARYAYLAAAAGAPPPIGALMFSAEERWATGFGYAEGAGAAAEEAALLAGLASASSPGRSNSFLPMLTTSSPLQVAPLPPPPGQRIQRTWPHSHASVTVLFRALAAGHPPPASPSPALPLASPPLPSPLPSPSPIIVQQDGSRATHGGQLAAITQAVLRTVAAAPPGATPTATATSEQPTSIPLAVLGTFVFPTATAEFYIFEPRYRLLFGRLATSGAPFAIGPMSPSPQPPTTRVPTEAEAELKGKELEEQVEAPLGLATLAALEEHTLLPDGRLRIRVRGLRRFDFKEAAVLPASFGLWLVTPSRWLGGADEAAAAAAAALGAARPPSPMPRETAEDEGADTRRLGPALVAQLEQAAQRQGWSLRELDEAAGSPPMHSDTQLSWWLASLLPAPPDVKRRWFVTEGASSRLKVIGDWMKDAL